MEVIWKNGLNNVLIVLIIALFIIGIYNLALNIKYKSEIAKIIKIDNIKDFDIKKIVRGYGPGTDPMFITFKISVDNYNTYSLNYYDVKQDRDFYEGEITNKKIKVDNYYICCYAISGYNTEDVKIISKVKTNKVILKIIEILLTLLIIILFIYFFKINKNNIISKKIK